MNDKRPIGLLDSGVGGLTVVHQVMKQLPHEDVVFIGDEAHMPYGIRPNEEIIKYTHEMVQYLISQNVKAIIYACNTATARALPTLKQEFDIPMFGVIKSGAEDAVNRTKTKEIAVIGTETTIKSNSYPETIEEIDSGVEVLSIPAQDFVKIVEDNTAESTAAQDNIAQTLKPITNTHVDTLILGCTHFPMLEKQIQNFVGENVTLVDPAIETATVTKTFLTNNGLLNQQHQATIKLNTTANLSSFTKLAKDWLGDSITEINLVKLGEAYAGNNYRHQKSQQG